MVGSPREPDAPWSTGAPLPVIVDRSANLDTVIEPIVKGGYYHAGQVCVSTQRIFVHQDIIDGFVERLAAQVGLLRVGDPLLRETDVGPLIDPRETSTRRVVAGRSDIARGAPAWRRPILGDDADAGRSSWSRPPMPRCLDSRSLVR